jgi:hypothetical protein
MSSRSFGSSIAIAVVAAAAVCAATAPASAGTASLTKAHARTIGKAINVRSSDFPGYSSQSAQPSASDKAIAKTYAKCVGTSAQFVNVTSPEFDSSSGAGFSSSVAFVSSPAALKRDAQRIQAAHGQACLKQSFVSATAEAGAPGAAVTLTPLTLNTFGRLSALFGYQITITVSILGQSESLHGYQIDFGRGNAEVELDELGLPQLAQSVMTKPLETLIKRAKQQVPAAGLPLKSS